MKRRILPLTAILVAAMTLTSTAAVIATFDSDTEGFVLDTSSVVTGGTPASVTHSTTGGGMMQLQADGGYEGQLSKFSGLAGAWATEVNNALANGGTVSFDVLVEDSSPSQVYTASPSWFEVVLISQGQASGWDSETISLGLGSGQWPIAGGSLSTTVSLDIVPGAANGGDGKAQFDATDMWRNFFVGINNGNDTDITTATVLVDNFQVSANPVPEPSSLVIVLACDCSALGMIRRR